MNNTKARLPGVKSRNKFYHDLTILYTYFYMLVLQTSIKWVANAMLFLQINEINVTNYRKWDEELHNYKYTETFVAKRLKYIIKRLISIVYFPTWQPQSDDHRYKFSRNMCPRGEGSEIFLDEICRNLFISGVSHPNSPLPFSDGPVRPGWRYVSVGPVSESYK
jgi:hypothetical protein